jgi:hypothetical protein
MFCSKHNGMLSAIETSNFPCQKQLMQPIKTFLKLDAWKANRFSTDEINSKISNKQVIDLDGDPGTTALIDTGVVYHEGGCCKERVAQLLHKISRFNRIRM